MRSRNGHGGYARRLAAAVFRMSLRGLRAVPKKRKLIDFKRAMDRISPTSALRQQLMADACAWKLNLHPPARTEPRQLGIPLRVHEKPTVSFIRFH
jgi:hypothetical protein